MKKCANPVLRDRRYALSLAALTAAFTVRVMAQALQAWSPVSWLPQAAAFQGGNLPYGILLASQVVILGVMIRVSAGVYTGSTSRRPRLGLALAWIGWIYMGGSIGRIVIGLAMPDAGSWFTAWIPAVFHLVLAGFILVLSAYHRAGQSARRSSQRDAE